jgi:RNA polymerase sigma factor (sigma-70 family)
VKDDFEDVFDAHVAEIHRYLSRRVGTALADDLTADVFATAFARRRTYDPAKAAVRPWLYGIAQNVLRGHRRTERRQLAAYARLGVDPVADPMAVADDRVDAERAGPRLAEALLALGAKDRETLLLFAWSGMTYDEVAAAAGVPVGTVRSRLHRARATLRERLGPRILETGGIRWTS